MEELWYLQSFFRCFSTHRFRFRFLRVIGVVVEERGLRMLNHAPSTGERRCFVLRTEGGGALALGYNHVAPSGLESEPPYVGCYKK